MPVSRLNTVLGRVRAALERRGAAGEPDGALLRRYVRQRDQTAFEALVRRHGPMVMGVCRRVLRNAHDAEDAFQATFLVLVKKAAGLRSPGTVASWLYGVAYRTALHARDAALKRRAKEAEMVPPPPSAERSCTDLRLDLDQELERLPEKYRAVLVLCDLEGRARKEAAHHLGWPEGTVASRLAEGRKLLARRLTRLGLAAPGGALAAVLSQDLASASVRASVVSSTLRAANVFAAGQAAAAGSLKVAALTEGALKSMFVTKLQCVVGALLALGTLALGTGLVAGRLAAVSAREAQERLGEPEMRVTAERPESQQAEAPEDSKGELQGTLLFYKRARAPKDGGKKPESQARGPRPKDERPRKLPKAPGPSPELRRELAALDAYRNGPAEKFVELEKKAAALLQRFPSPDDQARIYYEVAHIAAQSDIRHHVERVRKYARKGLALSRDPLQRAWLFSYLGSAAEVDTAKPFPERRREAARDLLAGYAEMLAQGLPKAAPELPRVDKVDNSQGPADRARDLARHAAQTAAREEAEFTRDLVWRRDTLADQLKGLYRPDPKVYGRGPEGPEELRELARGALKDQAAVDALLAHVTAR